MSGKGIPEAYTWSCRSGAACPERADQRQAGANGDGQDYGLSSGPLPATIYQRSNKSYLQLLERCTEFPCWN